jgi:non-homologous end joining protein Ku
MGKSLSTLTINVGLLPTKGGLHAVRVSPADTKLVMLCPACEASQVSQVYTCNHGCKPTDGKAGWTTGQIPDRARLVGGKPVKVPHEEIEATSAGIMMKGVLDVAVHPAAEVESSTYPSGSSYCFVPATADKVYALLLQAAANPTIALVGIVNMRGTERLYRLQAHQGTLRLVELLRPEDTVTFVPVELPSVADAEAAMFGQVLDALMQPFQAEDYESGQLAALRALIESKTGAVTGPVPARKGSKTELDVMAALQASLAALVSEKAAA